jgi:hypothetical protein
LIEKNPINEHKLDVFFQTALELAESGIRGDKIAQAAKTGLVDTALYHRQPDETLDARVRFYIVKEVYSIWNDEKRDACLQEIYERVIQDITSDIERKEWPRIWGFPPKRSVDRRVNQCADRNHPEFWSDAPFPHLICLKAGWYRPNPRFFDDDARDAIAQAGETI